MYREFWGIVVEYGRLRLLVFIIGITILVSVLEALNIGLLIPLLELLSDPNGESTHWISSGISNIFDSVGIPVTLGSVLIVLAVIVTVNAVFKYIRYIVGQHVRIDFIVWNRSSNMKKFLEADLEYFHRVKLGILTDSLTTQAQAPGDSLHHIIEIVSAVGILLMYLVTALLISPELTGIAVGMMVVTFLAVQWYVFQATTIGTQRAIRENELQVSAVESLSGIHVIKSFMIGQLRWQDFNERSEKIADSARGMARNHSQMLVLQELILFALVACIVYLGVTVLDLGIAVMVALLFTLYRLMPQVSLINNRRHGLAASLAAVQRVKEIIDEGVPPKVVSGERQFDALDSEIGFHSVGFSYNGGAHVLNGTGFAIEKGKMTAIVGMSGAGKTTIINLLLRHYDPVEGQIKIDGVDLKEFDLESWRLHIGLVSQDVFLFNDTVGNNIAMGRSDYSYEEIVDASKRAYADQFIQQLPHGYQTAIGDRGSNLSGGQRQRIALARAILTKPNILILDEATSSLDSESEQLVQEYISSIKGTCTLVVVAHRMSTIRSSDKILVLQEGGTIEEGNWESLLASSESFSNYHRLQFGMLYEAVDSSSTNE